MSESAISTEGDQPAVTAKWVPRWRQNPNAVPSVRLYTEQRIREAIPGERKGHTFTRALASLDATASDADSPQSDKTEDVSSDPLLSDEICRIMVHDKAHLNPPHELWTRNNFEEIDSNIGRPLPLFQEAAGRGHMFEFLGWYRIVRWTRCRGGGEEVMSFIQKRKISQAARTREYWESALRDDWAQVTLEKVNDPTLRNPMEPSPNS